ncbi:hypothetical protein EYF80_028204 [Liparis tanakae]|uniref:Uncharacterized protein n=1 Tax=Liparis tanakae TaxID=230148 RepID=A0A4Z2H9Y5_9TELE|nr:hypothetical protein EYF80_028204 [Liparis tanakae]
MNLPFPTVPNHCLILQFRKHAVSFSSKSWTRSSIDVKLQISPEKLLSRSEKSSRPDDGSPTFEFNWSGWSVDAGWNSLKSCQSSSKWANGAAMTAVGARLTARLDPLHGALFSASRRWTRPSSPRERERKRGFYDAYEMTGHCLWVRSGVARVQFL